MRSVKPPTGAGSCLHFTDEETSPSPSHGPPRSSSPLSSGESSLSSTSLERAVSNEAQEDALVAKVRSLQHEAAALCDAITAGRTDVERVRSTLDDMLRRHVLLATAVSEAATSLEAVNSRSEGRAARHIATSLGSLASELCVLAEHLSALEGTLHRAQLPSPLNGSCTSIKTGGSPRLPDTYLTPSRPLHPGLSPTSSESFHSSPQSLLVSPPEPHSSPKPPESPSPSPPESEGSVRSPSSPSSLSDLDPFTPDTSFVLPPAHTLSQLALMNSPPNSFPPTPLVSSPCADSGVSSSGYSSQAHTASSQHTLSPPPPSSQHTTPPPPYPPPPSITMEDIAAMKAELARLRDDIRNTSNWSLSLAANDPSLSAPSTPATHSLSSSATHLETGLPGITGYTNTSSGITGYTSTSSLTTPSYLPTKSSTVSRPFQSVPRPFSLGSMTHGHLQLSTTPHRRLFPDRENSIHRDRQNGIRTEYKPRTRSRSVQTMPTTPNFGTKTWDIENRTPSQWAYSSPTLPTNFTPHLLFHTIHHSPSHHSHTPSHLHYSHQFPTSLQSSWERPGNWHNTNF